MDGAKFKEGLIPVNMCYLPQSLIEKLSAEAFYQLDWQQTVMDNCSTFFSQNNFVAVGCQPLPVGPNLSANHRPNPSFAPGMFRPIAKYFTELAGSDGVSSQVGSFLIRGRLHKSMRHPLLSRVASMQIRLNVHAARQIVLFFHLIDIL